MPIIVIKSARSGFSVKKYKNLKIEGAILNEKQLEEYLKKISLQHNIGKKSDKLTYPIPQLLENYNIIKIVYNLLNKYYL